MLFVQGLKTIYNSITNIGNVGVAFLYSYPTNFGDVAGIDFAIYRGDFKNDLKNQAPNPIIHTWTLEKHPHTSFKELHRNKDGTMCAYEAIMLGKETELLLDVLQYSKTIDDYLNTWSL